MDKKLKLSLSGKAKKPLKNIDVNKFSGKRSVVIEKSQSKIVKRGSSFASKKPLFDTKFKTNTSDFEKRKLAEQRATKRLKDESNTSDKKHKLTSKKREVKLTVSRALSDEIEARERSLASVRRAREKENKNQHKEPNNESVKTIKRDINIPEAITVRELANRMA